MYNECSRERVDSGACIADLSKATECALPDPVARRAKSIGRESNSEGCWNIRISEEQRIAASATKRASTRRGMWSEKRHGSPGGILSALHLVAKCFRTRMKSCCAMCCGSASR